ncbi:transglutaminase-like domain-containing protein [Dinghuibacter silviterrae]
MRHTKDLSVRLKGKSLRETCSNIWHFVYRHIQYKKDQPGYEQIRSPARSWLDRRRGVDCDCYSVFISTVLANMDIPHVFRITKYKADHFQHIYPVVITENGEIILDCVTDDFDYEVPYSEKKDFPMDLQFLNGPGDDGRVDGAIMSPVRFGEDLGDLGKIKLKGLLNKLNKFNPATILLRNGLLASMKLNLGGVAGKLRWSYLTPAQAASHKVSAQKLAQLVSVRKTLESIFYGAGGKLNNLKKAILKGKGNKDKAVVAGLGSLDFSEIDAMGETTPLEQLLGPEIYNSENERTFQGLAGFGALGEPVTIASISAAAAVIAKLVAALKKVGGIFSGGKKEDDSTAAATSSDTTDPSAVPDSSGGASTSPSSTPATPAFLQAKLAAKKANMVLPASAITSDNTPDNSAPDPVTDSSPSGSNPTGSEDAASTSDASSDVPITTPVVQAAKLPGMIGSGSPTPPAQTGFWQKNKRWLKPVAIGAGGIVVLAVGYHLLKGRTKTTPLSGGPTKPRNHHRKKKHPPKKAVALI